MNVKPNTIFTGDNLPVLRGMTDNCIDLIYLDPPFNSNRNYSAPIGSKAAGASFKDAWTFDDVDNAWHGEIAESNHALYKVIDGVKHSHSKGMAAYLIYMSVRLIEMYRILKDTGSIYLHCDPTASHYLKAIMDCILGKDNFRNEIVWGYPASPSVTRKDFPKKHDTILRYSVSRNYLFNPDAIRIPYSESSFNRAKYSANRSSVLAGNKIKLREGGKIPPSVWVDIQQSYRYRSQYTGYPTQKPARLLERIIKASSNEGDIVMDPFCGCATACVAAQDAGRNWIGIDISELAYTLIKNRFRDELGLFKPKIIHRTDIPQRQGVRSRNIKHVLYGQQGGDCWGCGIHFHPQNLTIDHIVPVSLGGINADANFQLLCGSCNSTKGNRPMAYLISKLKEKNYPIRKTY